MFEKNKIKKSEYKNNEHTTAQHAFPSFNKTKSKNDKSHTIGDNHTAYQHMRKMQKILLKEERSVFAKLTNEEYELINSFSTIIDDALKLKTKQKKDTLKAIRILFQELTSERTNKNIDYLSEPSKLSAYIYYYLWWNLLRFVRLFNGLELNIKSGDIIGDFGSGPLTLVLALWIAKPELRNKKLTFYCIDISEKAIKAGEEIFRTLVAFTTKHEKPDKNRKTEKNKSNAKEHTILTNDEKQELNWKIKRVVAPFGVPLKEKLDFFFSANMFNEICWKNIKKLKTYGEKQAIVIDSYIKNTASVLIIEPGLPIGGKIISMFRTFFLQKDYSILAPCPHIKYCPLHERPISEQLQVIEEHHSSTKKHSPAVAKGKWCHFTFSTINAPSNLIELSERVHLAKKTASLSYLYCCKNRNDVDARTKLFNKREMNTNKRNITVIITSNIIKLKDENFGVYACSELGFLLLKTQKHTRLKTLKSGSYFTLEAKKITQTLKDKKSGALIIEI